MARLTITLHPKERDALQRLAMRERRNPQDQAAFMLRRDLVTLGLLPGDSALAVLAPDKPKPCEVTHGG